MSDKKTDYLATPVDPWEKVDDEAIEEDGGSPRSSDSSNCPNFDWSVDGGPAPAGSTASSLSTADSVVDHSDSLRELLSLGSPGNPLRAPLPPVEDDTPITLDEVATVERSSDDADHAQLQRTNRNLKAQLAVHQQLVAEQRMHISTLQVRLAQMTDRVKQLEQEPRRGKGWRRLFPASK